MRWFAIDLDGTLLNKKHQISEANRTAIKRRKTKEMSSSSSLDEPPLMRNEYSTNMDSIVRSLVRMGQRSRLEIPSGTF